MDEDHFHLEGEQVQVVKKMVSAASFAYEIDHFVASHPLPRFSRTTYHQRDCRANDDEHEHLLCANSFWYHVKIVFSTVTKTIRELQLLDLVVPHAMLSWQDVENVHV